MNNKQWMVIYSKPRWEKKIDETLLKKGIESWCPLNKVEKQWSDRKKIIEEPLFKSYVFVRVGIEERNEVLITPGVLNFVYHSKKPAIIRDEDIDAIKRYLVIDNVKIEVVSSSYFQEHTKVKVSQGVFLDLEGIVVKSNKKKVYVKLESLEQVMIVEFRTEHLTKIVD